jgi:four helix bundle protein
MGDFRKLKVWEKAHELALEIYRVTAAFPPEERFGLTSQLRLSAASVPTNLAEGSGRNSQKELARFCRISLGSANELESQLILARDLHYLDAQDFTRRSYSSHPSPAGPRRRPYMTGTVLGPSVRKGEAFVAVLSAGTLAVPRHTARLTANCVIRWGAIG